MAPAPSGTTITFRCDEDFKTALAAAAAAEGRDMSDFIVQAARQRIDAVCPRCGRVDRPTTGAGLSEAFTAFLEKVYRDRDMQPVAVTVTTGPKVAAYRARINLLEQSQGQLLMLLDFHQGRMRYTAAFPIPRGIITGWQQDNGHHLEHLTEIGYINGNDSVIRGYLRGVRPEVVTVRAVSDAICEKPGINDAGLREYIGLFGAPNASSILAQAGLIVGTPTTGWKPLHPNPDVALHMARQLRIDVDEAVA
jgi:hypothetical protein